MSLAIVSLVIVILIIICLVVAAVSISTTPSAANQNAADYAEYEFEDELQYIDTEGEIAELDADSTPAIVSNDPDTTIVPVKGRYIRLERKEWPESGSGSGFVNVLEIKAYGASNEVLSATSSSAHPQYLDPENYGPQYLIDNMISNQKVTQTTNDASAYVEIDLGAMKDIGRIIVENVRNTNTQPRILGTQVSILDNTKAKVWISDIIQTIQPTYMFSLPDPAPKVPNFTVEYAPDKYFMYGPGIKNNLAFIPAIKMNIGDGKSVYIGKDGNLTKMVDDTGVSKYYHGDPSLFDVDKWNNNMYSSPENPTDYMARLCPANCPGWCDQNKNCQNSIHPFAPNNERIKSEYDHEMFGGAGEERSRVLVRTRQTDLCLDIRGGSTDDNAELIAFNCHDGDNQKFTMDANHRLSAKHSGKCLQPKDKSTSYNTDVVQATCDDTSSQKWYYDGQNRLRPDSALDKCLQTQDESSQNLAKLVIVECSDSRSQKWRID